MYTNVPAYCDERLVQQIILSILWDLVQYYEDQVRLCEEKSKIDREVWER